MLHFEKQYAISQNYIFYCIFTYFYIFRHNKSGNNSFFCGCLICYGLIRLSFIESTCHKSKPTKDKGELLMKDTFKKIIAITAICLIAAQTVSAASVKDVEGTEIILCSDKQPTKPIKV